MGKATVAAKLKAKGIKTFDDLDVWIRKNPRKDKWGRTYLMSKYSALVEIVGENAAINMMHELSLRECCPPPKGHRSSGKPRRSKGSSVGSIRK